MSEELINYLGWTLEEFGKEFMSSGYPKVFDNISDDEEILNMYTRDIYSNLRV